MPTEGERELESLLQTGETRLHNCLKTESPIMKTCFCFLFNFLAVPHSMWDLNSQSRYLTMEVHSRNH